MALSKRQQKWILKNRKLSPDKIAKKINVDVKDVEEFLQANKPKPVPKYFYVILVLIPVIFLILLELGLRLFNYGNEYNQWVEVTKTTIGLNPEIGRKYFSKTKALPESIQDVFDKEKKENSYRIFVLGGSSAAGYPFMPLGSFSRYIDQRLKHVYPNKKIEVVNISLTAINSYTIRDFIPGVLEQKPDLILVYAGHNEYYGALGIGSMESLGSSREMVNLILYLNKYRTTQLIRNFISWAIGLFGNDEEVQSGTLMARIAEDQAIPLNSETYRLGVEQFRGNLRDVIEMIRSQKVNLIIGNLVSNIKDQKPFISKGTNTLPSANEIYFNALAEYIAGNYHKSDSLFRFAKDLDLLRFRAPEDFNKVISELSDEYNIPLADIESAFEENSPNGIIGNNLMIDHLHPTVKGYQLMGKIFYESMARNNFLPADKPLIENLEKQDSVTVANYYFSELDSICGDYKIKVLKNDWPFLKDLRHKQDFEKLLNPLNKIDSLAYEFVVNDKAWIDIQQSAANYYLSQNDIDRFLLHMDILIYQYPVLLNLYNKTANELMKKELYDEALKYLTARYNLSPDAYSAKWLGIINLSKQNDDKAIEYLKTSLSFIANDEQVLYNLAGAYSRKKNYELALENVKQALQINPNYTAALSLKSQLEKALQTSR